MISERLNKLTNKDLSKNKIAKNVIENFFKYRLAKGEFKNAKELTNVKGIGQKLAARLCEIALNHDVDVDLENIINENENKTSRMNRFLKPPYECKVSAFLFISNFLSIYYININLHN